MEQRKPVNWRVAAIFASGLLLGAAAAAWAVLHVNSPDKPATAPAPAEHVVKGIQPAAKATPTAAQKAAAVAHVACPGSPVLASANRADGQLKLQKAAGSSDIAALILNGKEAAAAGRPRDAEVAFLSACHAADQLQRADATEPTDARYQLARHYANVLLVANGGGSNRAELARRADALYADSVQAYSARYGPSHEKTRFAAEGLATLRETFAQAPKAAPAPKPVVVAQPEPSPPVQPAKPVERPKPAIAAAPSGPPKDDIITLPVRQATGAPTQSRAQPRPSFDCALARSPAERRICADSELAQLDRDLGRLHARAKNAAPDAAAFRRENDREWRRRESTCGGDRECLVDWYAQRREQLLEDLDE